MRQDDWLPAQLPLTMSDDDFLRNFLKIFQSVADTVLDQIDALPDNFDPAVAPPQMVREMGRWLGIDWLDSSYSEPLQRRIVLEYADLLPMRGTRTGLERLVQLISGDQSAYVDDKCAVRVVNGEDAWNTEDSAVREPSPRHVQVTMSSTPWADEMDVVRIIEGEIPLHTTFELSIGGRTVWPEGAAAAPPDPSTETDRS